MRFLAAASWNDATIACLSKNAELAGVLNDNENAFIQKEFVGNVWLGLSRCHQDSTCLVDSTPAKYTNWAPGQPCQRPQTPNSKYAVLMGLIGGKWLAKLKIEKHPYVCKRTGTVLFTDLLEIIPKPTAQSVRPGRGLLIPLSVSEVQSRCSWALSMSCRNLHTDFKTIEDYRLQ